MDFDSVKSIIGKYYEQHASAYLDSSVCEDDAAYFYNADDFEKEVAVLESVQEVFFAGVEPEGHIDYPLNSEEGYMCRRRISDVKHLIECKEIKRESSSYVLLHDYLIDRIELSPYKGRTIPMIRKCILPRWSLAIKDNDELYRVTDKGLRYLNFSEDNRLSGLIIDDEKIRMLIANILNYMGCKPGKSILKDVARAIEKGGVFLPPINMHEIIEFHNPNQFFHHIKRGELPRNFNKWDMNCAYTALTMSDYSQIRKEDRNLIFDIPQEKIWKWGGIFGLSVWNVPYFIGLYYSDKFGDSDQEIRWTAENYAHVCIEIDHEISLRIKSAKKLKEEYDEKVQRMIAAEEDADSPLTLEHSRFKGLRDILPEEFVWIRTLTDLYGEGLCQHNCVYMYRDYIKADECAIYHWQIEDRSYTIKFGIRFSEEGSGRYAIKEMRQKFNKPALDRDKKIVEKLIDIEVGDLY